MNKFSCLCKMSQAVTRSKAYLERYYIDVHAKTKEEAKDICMHLPIVENVICVYSYEEPNVCYEPTRVLQDELA